MDYLRKSLEGKETYYGTYGRRPYRNLEVMVGRVMNYFGLRSKELDWWMFAKLDQYLDVPFVPYYSPAQNRMARFVPDFIFWGRKGNDYRILFLDPKGMENQEWERKAEGFMDMFESGGKPKNFEFEGMRIQVHLSLFTRDRNPAAEGGFKRFWKDQIRDALEPLMS